MQGKSIMKLLLLFSLLSTTIQSFSKTLQSNDNTNDSAYCPGEYKFIDMVVITYSILTDHTFNRTNYGCLGKISDDTGQWNQVKDTIFLKFKTRKPEKYLVKTLGLYSIHYSDTQIQISYKSTYKCFEKFGLTNQSKVTYHYNQLCDTLMIIGYFNNGNIAYINTYNRDERPIGTWYYFLSDGNLSKTVNYTVPVMYPTRRKRRQF
ncbi:MAG: hypothetical protein V4613_07720 [Bacteroidota bacterium]